MGEYAEMMLDGAMCSSCGEYLGTDAGYPIQCLSCRRDEERDSRPRLEWKRIKSRDQLGQIAAFVKSQPVNTFGLPRTDRKGDWIMLLGWDDRPDSDWGRFKGNRAALWFGKDEALAMAGEIEVGKALGFADYVNRPSTEA